MSEDMNSATSLPESADGRLPFSGQDGAAPSGREVVPVSRFRAQDSEKEMPTNAISGPLFNASSPSAVLQWSLESRLRARMEGSGCPLYELTWKQLGYACGAADLSAAGVGAPHIRQRLYWVAYASNGRYPSQFGGLSKLRGKDGEEGASILANSGATDGLGNANVAGPQGRSGGFGECASERAARAGSAADGLVDSESQRWKAIASGAGSHRQERQIARDDRPAGSNWDDLEWLACVDGKARPTQPGIHPLAYGLPSRVGEIRPGSIPVEELAGLSSKGLKDARYYRINALRGYGNAIVPQVATIFIQSVMEAIKLNGSS